MIARECQCNGLEQPVHTGLGQIFTFIGQLCLRYGQWLEMKDQHRVLMSMDHRMLNDIGLSRADAVRLTTGHSFWKHMQGETSGPGHDPTAVR